MPRISEEVGRISSRRPAGDEGLQVGAIKSVVDAPNNLTWLVTYPA